MLDQAVLTKLAITLATQAARNPAVTRTVRQRLGLDPTRRALRRALAIAIEQLEYNHPSWAAALFDASLMEHEAAPVLARLLTRSGRPDPSELARRWALAINLREPDRRNVSVRELERVAADFLDDFAAALRDDTTLHDVADGQALDALAEDVSAIRTSLGAEQATAGTRWDYLRWLIGRNTYLDVRGIPQTPIGRYSSSSTRCMCRCVHDQS